MTTRTPQVVIRFGPDDSLIAESFINGHRTTTPITTIDSIRRILVAQRSYRHDTIGFDARPTAAQVKHWETHTECEDPTCSFCLAESIGIDQSIESWRAAQTELRVQRAKSKKPLLQTYKIGDGSATVTYLPPRNQKIKPKKASSKEPKIPANAKPVASLAGMFAAALNPSKESQPKSPKTPSLAGILNQPNKA